MTEQEHATMELAPVTSAPETPAPAKAAPETAAPAQPPAPGSEPSASLRECLTFATAGDLALMAVGLAAVVVSAANQPAQLIIFGTVLESFNQADGDVVRLVQLCALLYVLVGVQQFVTQFAQTAALAASAGRQAARFRAAYLRALLRQEVGWFDTGCGAAGGAAGGGGASGELASAVMEDGLRFQDGLGEKLGLAVQFVLAFVLGFGVALWYCWPLALAMMAIVPTGFGAIAVVAMLVPGAKGLGGPGAIPDDKGQDGGGAD